MIIVTVKSTPLAEYKQAFLTAFKEISALVYSENGCIEYEIYQDEKDSNRLFIFERWESKAALDTHLSSDHMKEFFQKTKSWFDTENEMYVYQVNELTNI